jgi:hypothetical protein
VNTLVFRDQPKPIRKRRLGHIVTAELLETQRLLSAAEIYNSTLASWAISAAWELGALDELNEHGKLDAIEFATRKNLDPASTVGMFAALASVRAVHRDDTLVWVGPNFEEVEKYRSIFHWLARGCSGLFTEMPSVLRNENRQGEDFYQRDAGAISFACREINGRFWDPTFWRVMNGIDFKFTHVADLGSGSAARLIQILQRFDATTGLGIDIAQGALDFAAAAVAEAGLSDRISFALDDARNLTAKPEYEKVELLTCFMMGHDFWPREDCVRNLRNLRALFPNVRKFLLGDATRTVGIEDADKPVFSLGFEVGHDMMATYMPTIDEWLGVFGEAGWHLDQMHRMEIPAASVIFELS